MIDSLEGQNKGEVESCHVTLSCSLISSAISNIY